ncbi:MAG: AIR synthase-related protein [Desulfurococcales archaeon]|nr:AIR synthase-related protein [Desulfurococcales archaeon]
MSERDAALEAARASGVPGECVESDSCPWHGLLAAVDGYSAAESRLPWMTWRDWGWKAAVAAASDVAASGGSVGALLVSVGAPEPRVGVEVAAGVGEAAAWMGATVLGGDMNSCRCGDAWVDVTVIGRRLYWSPRWAARPGDVLVRAGPLGYGVLAAAALKDENVLDLIPGNILDYTRRPRPPLGLPLALALEGCPPRAGVDNSDGWAETLWLMAEASRVRLLIDSLDPSSDVRGILEALGLLDPLAVASSAEDYTLLLSIDSESAECALSACRKAGVECLVVGRVERGEPGVYYRGKPLPRRGWDSFASQVV